MACVNIWRAPTCSLVHRHGMQGIAHRHVALTSRADRAERSMQWQATARHSVVFVGWGGASEILPGPTGRPSRPFSSRIRRYFASLERGAPRALVQNARQTEAEVSQ